MTVLYAYSKKLATALALLAALPAAQALTDLGPGGLFLDLGGEIEYDSNIYTNDQEIDDFIFRVIPTLVYTQDRGLIHLNATAGTSFNEYSDQSDQSGTDIRLGFNLSGMHREPAPALGFSLSGNWADESIASREIATRIDIERYNIDGSANFRLSDKTSLRGSGGYSNDDYKDDAFNDSEDVNARADFLYAYSEKLFLRTGYRYREIKYDNRTQESDTLIFGAEGELTEKVSGSIEAGISDDDQYDGTRFYYSVDLNWSADENTSFSLTGSRDYTPSAIGANAASTDLRLGMSQRLTQSLNATSYIGYGRWERGGDLDRSDNIFEIGTRFSLQVGEQASVYAAASYEDRDSDSTVSDYGRLQLTLGGSVRY